MGNRGNLEEAGPDLVELRRTFKRARDALECGEGVKCEGVRSEIFELVLFCCVFVFSMNNHIYGTCLKMF